VRSFTKVTRYQALVAEGVNDRWRQHGTGPITIRETEIADGGAVRGQIDRDNRLRTDPLALEQLPKQLQRGRLVAAALGRATARRR
jgi:hypothetical protein